MKSAESTKALLMTDAVIIASHAVGKTRLSFALLLANLVTHGFISEAEALKRLSDFNRDVGATND